MNLLRVTLMASFLLIVQSAALGQRRGAISEGSAAPGLDIESWFNGEAIAIEAGSVYVLMFMETGSNNNPVFEMFNEKLEAHANQNLKIAAISSEDASQVRQYAESLGTSVKFPLAADRRDSTDRAWVRASGQSNLPLAFIIDRKSTIQYIGSPRGDKFQEVLELVIDDRYDANLIREAQRYLQPAANARKVRNFRQCFMHLDKVIEMDKRVFAKSILMKFEIMLLDQHDPEAAYEYARQLIAENGDDPNFLSWMVELIVVDSRIADEDRDLDVAMAAAEAAFASYDKEEPHAYALKALVHYHRGEIKDAIDLQKAAWRIAQPREKDEYWRTLVAYKESARRTGALSSKR